MLYKNRSRRLIANTETTLESSLLHEEVEEEEVWLYWIDSHKEPHGKSIRHLAQDAKGNHKMDVDIITYYRSGWLSSEKSQIKKQANQNPPD